MNNTGICLSKDTNRKRPWLVGWWGQYDPKKGKCKRYSKSFKRKTDAEQFLASKKQEFTDGMPRDQINVDLETLAGKMVPGRVWVSIYHP